MSPVNAEPRKSVIQGNIWSFDVWKWKAVKYFIRKQTLHVALHKGGHCRSRILSVHMYFCGDKQGQFLWLPIWMAVFDLASPLHALHWEFLTILNGILQYKCCQRIADMIHLLCTGLKTIFPSFCESFLVMFYSIKAFT